jgi:hypothetical protein
LQNKRFCNSTIDELFCPTGLDGEISERPGVGLSRLALCLLCDEKSYKKRKVCHSTEETVAGKSQPLLRFFLVVVSLAIPVLRRPHAVSR